MKEALSKIAAISIKTGNFKHLETALSKVGLPDEYIEEARLMFHRQLEHYKDSKDPLEAAIFAAFVLGLIDSAIEEGYVNEVKLEDKGISVDDVDKILEKIGGKGEGISEKIYSLLEQ